MHFIFVYFVRGGFRTKIKCILKFQSTSENPQHSATVRKFHAYERSGVPRIRKFSAYEIFWIYSSDFTVHIHTYYFGPDWWSNNSFKYVIKFIAHVFLFVIVVIVIFFWHFCCCCQSCVWSRSEVSIWTLLLLLFRWSTSISRFLFTATWTRRWKWKKCSLQIISGCSLTTFLWTWIG